MLHLWSSGKDDPEMAEIAKELHSQGRQIFLDVVEQEKEWADYLFKDGSMVGLNSAILKQYVEYIANHRMQTAGYATAYDVKANPIPWINSYLVSDNVQGAPQESEISSYLVGATDSNVEQDAFDDFEL